MNDTEDIQSRRNMPGMNGFLSGLHRNFVEVQNNIPKLHNYEDCRSAVLHYSQLYRVEIESFLERGAGVLERYDSQDNSTIKNKELVDDESRDMFEQYMKLTTSASSLWLLFEIFHINPAFNITSQIRDWIQRSTDIPDYYMEVINSRNETSNEYELEFGREINSEEYWNCVVQLLICGRVNELIHLLSLNDVLSTKYQNLTDLIQLVLICPSLEHASGVQSLRKQYACISIEGNDIEEMFGEWQQKVNLFIKKDCIMNGPLTNSGYHLLVHVLAGNVDVISTVSDHWLSMLMALLLYRKPHTTKTDLHWLIDECVDVKVSKSIEDDEDSSKGDMSLYDTCLRSIMTSEIVTSLRIMSQVLDLPWFGAHLVWLVQYIVQTPITIQDVYDHELSYLDDHDHVLSSLYNDTFPSDSVNGETIDEKSLLFFINSGCSLLTEYYTVLYADTFTQPSQYQWRTALSYYTHCPHFVHSKVTSILNTISVTPVNIEELLQISRDFGLLKCYFDLCSKMCTLYQLSNLPLYIYWNLRKGDNETALASCDLIFTHLYSDRENERIEAFHYISTLTSMLHTLVSVEVDSKGKVTGEVNVCDNDLIVYNVDPTPIANILYMHDFLVLRSKLDDLLTQHKEGVSSLVNTVFTPSNSFITTRSIVLLSNIRKSIQDQDQNQQLSPTNQFATVSSQLESIDPVSSSLSELKQDISIYASATLKALVSLLHLAPINLYRVLLGEMASLLLSLRTVISQLSLLSHSEVTYAISCIDALKNNVFSFSKCPLPPSLRHSLHLTPHKHGLGDSDSENYNFRVNGCLLRIGYDISDLVVDPVRSVTQLQMRNMMVGEEDVIIRTSLNTLLCNAFQNSQ